MSRALIRGAVCQSCRHEVLRSFLAVSGVPMPRYSYSTRLTLSSRAFSAAAPLRSDRPPVSNPPDITLSPVVETAPENEDTEPVASNVPWYLREEAPIRESRPIIGDHIPELPENSPEMLQVLLEYSYKDLGLDDLKLFDLRHLDIPAALGANVIMIVGTARSVKHLNVSADRLCRWLRKTYKLSPHADGLLGRNELKIKLRRKAKRARAASHAGTMIDEKDDGITTGWICVNAGIVDKGSSQTQLSDVGFEGFGQLDLGTSVVVQIFTEEKRADVDLDGLWQGTLDRAERSRLRHESEAASATDSPSASFSAGGMSTPGGQRRGFHTGRQTKMDSNQEGTEVEMSTDYLIGKLAALPHSDARIELGAGPEDQDSTLFLKQLYASLPPDAPSKTTNLTKLRLSLIAVSRQHPGYSKELLVNTLNDILSVDDKVPDELGFDTVAALLTPRLEDTKSQEATQFLPDADVELALQVLERLSVRGVPILTMRLFNMLYDVAALAPEPSISTEKAQRTVEHRQQLLTRLSKIVPAAQVSFDEAEARKLMFNQFRYQDIDGFWRLWRMFPLKNASRTQADYIKMFELHAELGDERRARDCLSTWVPMMSRETTPIILQGPIISAIKNCIMVADPEIRYREEDGSRNYFTALWAQCNRAIEQAEEMMEEPASCV
ncbi:ATPase synthesis protein 25 [Penicillium herquei]|nr:ATPase synthesis protein 25 [Penicillium herquei]